MGFHADCAKQHARYLGTQTPHAGPSGPFDINNITAFPPHTCVGFPTVASQLRPPYHVSRRWGKKKKLITHRQQNAVPDVATGFKPGGFKTKQPRSEPRGQERPLALIKNRAATAYEDRVQGTPVSGILNFNSDSVRLHYSAHQDAHVRSFAPPTSAFPSLATLSLRTVIYGWESDLTYSHYADQVKGAATLLILTTRPCPKSMPTGSSEPEGKSADTTHSEIRATLTTNHVWNLARWPTFKRREKKRETATGSIKYSSCL